MKKNKLSVLILGLAIGSSVQAADLASRDYEFKPKRPVAIDNPVFWQLKVKCKITTSDDEDLLTGVMKKKSGKLNDIPLKEGQQTSVVVKNNDVMSITADVGARVEITNQGQSLVKAHCST